MSQRQISLGPNGKVLLIASEYNDEIRLIIKSFSGARWNRDQRVWQVPVTHRDNLLKHLAPFRFHVSDDVSTEAVDITPPLDPETLSVMQLNVRIGATLARSFPESIWVRGELFNFDKGVNRRHWYFELVEKASDGDDVAARLSAVIFQNHRFTIERRLASAPEPLTLRDGLEVRFRGRVDFYPRSGRLQFIVEDVDTAFAFGQLAKRRREILDSLEREKLLERNINLPWPVLPMSVGLITANESDALHDFVRTLQQSVYGFRVLHVAAAVQGAMLESEVLAALDIFERSPHAVDVIAIIRGGGSRSDLAWFDNLEVARKVATHPNKVLVGIGHERDRSVLDELAASAKTPTGAAELIVNTVALAEDHLDRVARRVVDRTRQQLSLEQRRSALHASRLRTLAISAMARARQQVERQLAPGVQLAVRSRLAVEHSRTAGLRRRARPAIVLRSLTQLRQRTDELERRLKSASRRELQSKEQRLTQLEARLAAVDPAKTLARGFAIVRNVSGRIVRSPTDVPLGGRVNVLLHQGGLTAEVTEHLPPDRNTPDKIAPHKDD